ncbi:hypothetical protein TRFO_25472 [Tritrichomonas foetus]|uniref:Uncharacterized protein n=1 Tax=Tritrichomonas foetus TaxID=1144522 RepID=A0A1J4K697_9EUKA|nr:hypothetical protein TRFO_25472 [Tritrichomonas foetus]|eukprot:OHT06514.1 hypothetical protein TRFO_25472 [Tritrichomonas foetus]
MNNYKNAGFIPSNNKIIQHLHIRMDNENSPIESVITQIQNLYNFDTQCFDFSDKIIINECLSRLIHAFQHNQTSQNNSFLINFIIILLNSVNDDMNIIESALYLSSYFIKSNTFGYDELLPALLSTSICFIKTHQISILTCINALEDQKFYDVIVQTDATQQVIELIEENNFLPEHFLFLSLCVTKMNFFEEKLLSFGLKYHQEIFGIHLLSSLASVNKINLELLSNVVEFHLLNPNRENAESLLTILNLFALQFPNFFQSFENFFPLFFNYFDICNDAEKVMHLDIIYLLIPFYSIKLISFIHKVVIESISFSFILIAKICDVLFIFLQEVDLNYTDNFICLETFNVFERLLNLDDPRISIKMSEIVSVLVDINPQLVKSVLAKCTLYQTLESLMSSENEYICSFSKSAIKKINEEDEYDDDDEF